jgi:hypothetical protein
MRTTLIVTAMLAVALMGTGLAAAGPMDMEAQIAAAKTAADHEAIAAEYSKQAAEAREQAAHHGKLAETYKRMGKRAHLAAHCQKLSADYSDSAKAFEALAEAHRALAREAGK